MKLTDKEKSLCKQIAEKHVKEVKYGEWYLLSGKPILCAYANEGFHRYLEEKEAIIPLWTISDCISWLMEKGYYRIDIVSLEGRFVLWLVHEQNDRRYEPDGDTILEAFLKAVLAVLEEEKK